MWSPTATRGDEFIGVVAGQTASRLIEAASDLALVLDAEGTIVDLTVRDTQLGVNGPSSWRGRRWAETVTADSRDKVSAMLLEAASEGPPRWRQVHHPMSAGDDLPVLYSAVRLNGESRFARDGCIVAVGRDLRGTVTLHRRLVESQRSMERDYWRFREAETRYRNLFQTAPEAVLVVDGQTHKVLEANPAAESLAGRSGVRIIGAPLSSLFDAAAAAPLQAVLDASRPTGKREPLRALLAQGRVAVDVSVSQFRQGQTPLLLVRLVPLRNDDSRRGQAAASPADTVLAADLLKAYALSSPDGLVFTDTHGRILGANRAFAMLAQISSEEQARGQMLDRWLGRTGVEIGVLVTSLRQRGAVRLFTTRLRGEFGAVLDVEVSAAQIGTPESPTLAFAVRDIGRRLQSAPDRPPVRLSRSAGELAELVGRVPMKDIVSETTDLIERLCIETALQMTQDNRAVAAQLLGLSRQSLYVKLRRHSLGDLASDNPT
jgi:transcriptional regulator PpsR